MAVRTEMNIRNVQEKILDIMKYIDRLCREAGCMYFIMGGTALGAVRHKGFIPWDDDLDIFMTPVEYEKFRHAFEQRNSDQFVLQEWRTVPEYLEYAKVRMNGTTFIEHQFRENKEIHQGIYVDIMILHKCPISIIRQRLLYLECKYVTLLGLFQRNWKPKSGVQRIVLKCLNMLPNKLLATLCYKDIYRYDFKKISRYKYFYWITPAKFRQGLFDAEMFELPIEINFEDTKLYGSKGIKTYLACRYGDYMKLPPKEVQKAAVHAEIFDTEKDYKEYL